MIPYLLTGIIENILRTALSEFTSLYLNCPVGMSLVKVAVGRDHFRLEPDSELHSELVYLVNEIFKTALDLVFIYEPVSER